MAFRPERQTPPGRAGSEGAFAGRGMHEHDTAERNGEQRRDAARIDADIGGGA